MNKQLRGLVAGLIATVVLTILMVIKAKMGMLPQLNIPMMLAGMLGGALIVGWIAHFVIGIVIYGLVLANAYDVIPGANATVKGLVLSVIGWLIMMIILMPLAGAGLFGMNLGIMAPIATLILHLIYGAVLGASYDALGRRTVTA
ncbi:MAG: DUF6789 family protein [Rhodanobacteraceae bacterium]